MGATGTGSRAQTVRSAPGRVPGALAHAGPRHPGLKGAQAPRGAAGLCPHRARRPAPAPPPTRPAWDRRRRPAAARTAARRLALDSELTATSRVGPGQTRTSGLSGAGGCCRGPGRRQPAAWRPTGRSSPAWSARKLGPSLLEARGEGAGGAAPGRPYRPARGWRAPGLGQGGAAPGCRRSTALCKRAAGPGSRRCSYSPPTSRLPGPVALWSSGGAPAQGWREGTRAEPSDLPQGPAHVDCPGGAEGAAGVWACWAAGTEVPRGPGRTLLGRGGPAVSSLRLDSPSGRSPGRRDRPEAVAARILRPGCPLLRVSRQSLGVGRWGLAARACLRAHVCRGPSEARTQFWRGVCADVGHAHTCRHGFACVAAACTSACWGARAP